MREAASPGGWRYVFPGKEHVVAMDCSRLESAVQISSTFHSYSHK